MHVIIITMMITATTMTMVLMTRTTVMATMAMMATKHAGDFIRGIPCTGLVVAFVSYSYPNRRYVDRRPKQCMLRTFASGDIPDNQNVKEFIFFFTISQVRCAFHAGRLYNGFTANTTTSTRRESSNPLPAARSCV